MDKRNIANRIITKNDSQMDGQTCQTNMLPVVVVVTIKVQQSLFTFLDSSSKN